MRTEFRQFVNGLRKLLASQAVVGAAHSSSATATGRPVANPPWLDTRPPGRFDFIFTPKHGSWLNLIEGFFSKFARSVLRALLEKKAGEEADLPKEAQVR